MRILTLVFYEVLFKASSLAILIFILTVFSVGYGVFSVSEKIKESSNV